MANYPLCFCIFRIVLPCILTMCAILRPCGLSAIYLMFLLYLPFVQVPKATTILGRTGLYLKIMIGVSTITTLVQSAFITFAFITDPRAMMAKCSTLERVLRHVGFVYLNGASQITISTWVFPEYLMLITSVTIYVSCKKLAISRHPEDGETATLVPKKKTSNNYFTLFASIGRYNVLVALCLSAVMRPSLLGAVYFLVFLSCATWWACYKQLKQGFAILMRFVAGLVLIHLCLWYIYQMQWPQELADAESPVIRLLGLKPILKMTCDAPTNIIWTQQEWATYCAPLALYLLYYSIVVSSKLLLKPQIQKKQGTFTRLEGGSFTGLVRQRSQRLSDKRLIRSNTTVHRWQSATRKVRVVVHEKRKSKVYSEQTPLIRGASPSRTYSSRRLTNEGIRHLSTEEIPMDQLEEEYKPTLIENIMYVSETILQVIIQSSYIGTNIIMMAWSITYLSWVTFVLLIWANLLWLIPNQRKAMLRSSPFLVIYAWFLLISAYVYCLDLTEKELPSSLDNVNLSQIGFVKILVLPCNSLMIKCLYTGMFWITLRQYMQERIAERQSSALADMVAPLQVTVTTATGAEEVQKQSTKVMDKIGKYFRTFISTIWIWLVAVTLFGVAITGDKMTGFRIIYMALFVVFIISFQLSFRVWRRIMFGFWLTVIIYSMAMLVMVYTYQFDYFPYYWSEYLGVALEQQADIGLETYETKQLFVRLVTPTFFVIITVVQLHYFHKDFMALYEPISNEKKLNEIKVEREGEDPTSEEAEAPSVKFELSELGNLSAIETKQLFQNILQKSIYYWNLMFLFLEIHMSKLVLLVGVLETVMDPFALDMIVVILIVLGFSLGKKVRTIAIYTTSVLLSLSLLGRMIYQIKYFHPEEWNVNCTRHNLNETIITTNNDASWIGFSKLAEGDTLMDVVRWDVIFIVITTVWRIIKIRQAYHRAQFNIPQNTTGLMYPRITRADADRDLTTYLRYLLNYGYYKFGLEICLMATVAVIGIRMDMYALFYALWLCVLHSMSRKNVAKIWNVYLIFIAVLLPVQYMMAIGLPPTLCIELPWDTNATLKRFQEWAFLLDSTKTLPAQKLICDFVLFFLVCRQARVFKIERGEIGGLPYPGGSNKVIIQYSEDELFVNPVPDFITYCRSYLDVFKRSILLSMLWVTLAVIFLAGTNRVNLFSIGYLIGAFSFLWLGTDLYLWPIPKILKSWRWLLAYNVFVITVKVALQIVGCIFIKDISSGICWPIQLFGIGCVNKFEDTQFMKYTNEKSNCYVPREFMGLVWDGLSFACLIIQRRIFHSYNFFHMIDETKASAILASRGAELIEELRNKRMIEQEEHEHRVLEKIKAKMDRIKANQQRIQGDAFREVTTHHMEHSQLARSTSSSAESQTSPAGYHTPIDDDELPPLTPRSSLLHQQAPPSPYSAVMTISLDGYLEPRGISFSSPPNSDLNARPPSPEESFPVFSPPPYDAAPPYAEAVGEVPTSVQRQSSIGPPWMQGSCITPRQSISHSSRSALSHHEYGSSHTKSSGRANIGGRTPKTHPDELDDNVSLIDHKSETNSAAPVGKSYAKAVRSGDYYMFDDLHIDDLEELDDFKFKKSRITAEEEEEEHLETKMTVSELFSMTMKSDIPSAVRGTTGKDRRCSFPEAKQRSDISARSQESYTSAPPRVDEQVPKTVTIVEEPQPEPSTSRQDEVSLQELPAEEQQTLKQKILFYILFLWACIESTMLSLTKFLNKYSRDYRYVTRELRKEKMLLKETTNYSVGIRMGSSQVWRPAGSYHDLMKSAKEESTIPTPAAATYSPSDSYRNALISERTTSLPQMEFRDKEEKPPSSSESDTKAIASLPHSSELGGRRKLSMLTVPEIRILAPSMERGLDSASSTSSKSVISLFKILEEDEEEMSSYDQPTILRLLLSFWYVASSRSEVLCYFIIFLNQMKSATFLSLPLPLMVFLWGTLTLPRPSKTFWVTIIAYTEVIVLIKCMFQFEIIPWNKKSEIMIDPLYPPRIIGIERKPNYAVWDLLLLLVVFFHRFMLKSMGLWRTSVPPDARTYPGLYKMDEDGKLTPLKKPKDGRKKSQISKKHEVPTSFIDMSTMYYDEETGFLKIGRKSTKSTITNIKQAGKMSSTPSSYSGGAQEILTPYNPSEDTVSNKSTSSTYSKLSHKSDPLKDQDQEGVLIVTNDRVDPGDHFRASLKMAAIKYTESFKDFLGQMVDPTSRVAADVYSYMFLCDFFNFFVLLLGYTSFGAYQGDGGVTSYLEDNKIPVLFLLMLIMQFMLIIIDRGIYLRKNMLAKIIFQFSQIVLLHIWLFILYPTITERSFNSVIPPQMFYMVKCFYLLLSAYQIRCGYPTRILGNFICKGYNYVNMFLFKAFLALPFLFELRTVMDWMWTDTSMTVFDWMKMEDIFAHIFQIKCTRYVEAEYPQERGVKKKVYVKYIMGGGVLMLIIGIIWFPLVFFSLGNAVGMPNIPYDVTLELRIGPYEPIYHMSAQSNSIYQFSSNDLNTFQEAYSSNKMGFTFISNYEAADIAAVVLSVDSSNVWSISPPDRARMETEIESDKPLSVRLDYKVSHKTSKSEDSGIISNSVQILIPASADNITNPQRASLLAMLRGNDTVEPVVVGLIMPKFLKVTNKGIAKPVTQLMNNVVPGDQANSLRGIRIKLNTKSDGMGWWEIHENCSDANYIDYLNQIPYKDCDSIILYTFNDKIFPATLNLITGGGIVGLYTTFVLVAAHFLRGFFAGQCFKIMFEDMPCIDRVLQLCLDIYLVRESREFNLEEDLFAKLIFLFRSPETLIKWTRPIEEANDEEEDE